MTEGWHLHSLQVAMEHKHVIFGLGLGLSIGLGVGGLLTLHKGSTLSRFSQSRRFLDSELIEQVMDGKESNVTFTEFPYYLNEQTKVLLTNAAYVHLKQVQHAKFTKNLSPASRAILLTGPPGAEVYHQTLAKALSHFFQAKLLLLDVTDFCLKMQAKYGDLTTCSVRESLTSSKSLTTAAVQRLNRLVDSPGDNEERNSKASHEEGQNDLTSRDSPSNRCQSSEVGPVKASALKRSASWPSEDKLLVTALFRVLSKLAQTGPIILYLRDAERLIFEGPETYSLFHKLFKKLSGPVLILGSRLLELSSEQGSDSPDEKLLAALFPYNIEIKPPEDKKLLSSWKSQLEEDMKSIETQDNRNCISEVLSANDVECDDLSSISVSDTLLLGKYIEEIVMSAISYHLMNTEQPKYRDGRLVISSKSLGYGLSLFQAGQLDTKDAKLQLEANPQHGEDHQEASVKMEEGKEVSEIKVEMEKSDAPKPDASKAETSNKEDVEGTKPTATSAKPSEVPPDNEFEKRIRTEVIPAGEVGVSFKDIGALENVKEALQELVMLPLRRPELFKGGGLIKPCKGILLFGPPGTGKTMLAKAVATEAGASFINVSISTITSKWFGEDEKNVRALFTLAAKVAPTVIFIDEVDSMLGQRSRAGEHEAMRKIKNEFMAHWDGLLTKSGERILVLAATNRPFDLDEAIIRRFERRIMVGLPNAENREKILRTILAKEKLEKDFDFNELVVMTEGYSGSDLKNLCMSAAYCPIRELLEEEQQEAEKKAAKQKTSVDDKHLSECSDDAQKGEGTRTDGATEITASSDLNTSELLLRPLTMKDMRQAKKQVSASFATEGAGMGELQEWNELYGEGGCRKKQQLTYFL